MGGQMGPVPSKNTRSPIGSLKKTSLLAFPRIHSYTIHRSIQNMPFKSFWATLTPPPP